VLDGCDAILSGAETLRGNYPVDVVTTLAQICRVAERVFDWQSHYDHLMEAGEGRWGKWEEDGQSRLLLTHVGAEFRSMII
jgi:pyruvate kinase